MDYSDKPALRASWRGFLRKLRKCWGISGLEKDERAVTVSLLKPHFMRCLWWIFNPGSWNWNEMTQKLWPSHLVLQQQNRESCRIVVYHVRTMTWFFPNQVLAGWIFIGCNPDCPHHQNCRLCHVSGELRWHIPAFTIAWPVHYFTILSSGISFVTRSIQPHRKQWMSSGA